MKTLVNFSEKAILLIIVIALSLQSIVAQAPSVSPTANEAKNAQINASAVKFDKLSQKEVSTTAKPLLNFTAKSKIVSGGNILWDLTHGVYLGYEPSGDYSSLSTILNGIGYTITTTTAGVNNVDLTSYDIVVVCLGSNWNSVYTAAEVSALNTFVHSGGGLFILGENTDCPNENINPVAQQYGVTCGISYIMPLDVYLTNLQLSHPIFSGVSSVLFRAAGEITATSPATIIASDTTLKGAIAAAQIDSGRIVVMGDCSWCTNSYIVSADNQILAANVFDWLNTAGSALPQITVMPSSFNVFLQQNDSTIQTMTIGNIGTADLSWDIPGGSTIPGISITTTFAGGNNHRGNMFDVTAINTITITGFDIHPVSNTDIRVYYKSGTYVGFENDSAAWTLADSFSGVIAQPYGTPTPLPHTLSITIPSGQTYGIYVTSSQTSVSLNYTDGTGVGLVYASDANIQVKEGCGLEYPFSGLPFTPRVWNGNIYYFVGSAPPSFWSVSPASGVVSPGLTQDIMVKINSISIGPGSYKDSITVNSNDLANNHLKVPIDLTVTAGGTPEIAVSPGSFDFVLQEGDSVTQTLLIMNTGTGPLNWHIDNLNSMTPAKKLLADHSRCDSRSAWSKSREGASGNLVLNNSPILNVQPETVPSISSGEKILLLSSEFTNPYWMNLKSALVSTGMFSYSDFDSLNNPLTLTAADLEPYSAVLVWTDFNFTDPQMVGDVLKQYVDGGGGVVIATYAFSTPWAMQGGILDANYSPFLSAAVKSVSGILDSTSITQVGHPLFDGIVNAPRYWSNINYSDPALNVGGILLAEDTQGNNLIAENPNGKVVGISIFPGRLNEGNAEACRLFANALRYVGEKKWLSASPLSGTIGAGMSQTIAVKANAKNLIAGNYSDTIRITNNDPMHNPENVPVDLTVTSANAPVITVSPSSFDVTLQQGDSTERTLVIGNSGSEDLTFSISHAQAISRVRSSILQRSGILQGNLTVSPMTETGGMRTKIYISPDQIIKTFQQKNVSGQYDIAVIGAAPFSTYNIDVGQKLIATGMFNSVTVIDGAVVTPTLAELQAFDAILVYRDALFQNTDSLGNNIADYVDGGGGVVLAMFCMGSGGMQNLGGRFLTDNYYVIQPTLSGFHTGQQTLGVVDVPLHPIMQNVSAFDGGTGSYRPMTAATPGSEIVAHWSDGDLLVVTRLINNVRRVDLGFYPPSSDVGSGLWVSSTDGDLLMANSLRWVAAGSPWMKFTPTQGVVAAGATFNVTVEFNSKNLIAGAYSGIISIENNDPVNNPKDVPVSLTVVSGSVPVISVSPASFNVSLQQNDSTTRILTIGNTGFADLTWNISGGSLLAPRGNTMQKNVGGISSAGNMPAKNPGNVGASDASEITNRPMNLAGTQISYSTGTAGTILLWSSANNAPYWTIFTSILNAEGFTVVQTDIRPIQPNSSYIAIFTCEPFDTLSAIEVSDLKNYVLNGGKIIELTDTYYQNINRLLIEFGVTRGSSNASGSVISTHPIFNGVGNLTLDGGNWDNQLTVALPSIPIATCEGQVIASITQNDRVLVFGEDSPFSDYANCLTDSDNVQLLQNVISWIKVGTTYPLSPWLTVLPMSGMVSPGSSMNVEVKFNSTGLSSGVYLDTIYIHNNDIYHDPVQVPVTLNVGLTGVEEKNSDNPKEFALYQNYPNPFNPSTTIRFALPTRSHVKMEVINMLGQVIATLVNGELNVGYNSVMWQANVATGVYYCRITATEIGITGKTFIEVRKMLLLK